MSMYGNLFFLFQLNKPFSVRNFALPSGETFSVHVYVHPEIPHSVITLPAVIALGLTHCLQDSQVSHSLYDFTPYLKPWPRSPSGFLDSTHLIHLKFAADLLVFKHIFPIIVFRDSDLQRRGFTPLMFKGSWHFITPSEELPPSRACTLVSQATQFPVTASLATVPVATQTDPPPSSELLEISVEMQDDLDVELMTNGGLRCSNPLLSSFPLHNKPSSPEPHNVPPSRNVPEQSGDGETLGAIPSSEHLPLGLQTEHQAPSSSGARSSPDVPRSTKPDKTADGTVPITSKQTNPLEPKKPTRRGVRGGARRVRVEQWVPVPTWCPIVSCAHSFHRKKCHFHHHRDWPCCQRSL